MMFNAKKIILKPQYKINFGPIRKKRVCMCTLNSLYSYNPAGRKEGQELMKTGLSAIKLLPPKKSSKTHSVIVCAIGAASSISEKGLMRHRFPPIL